MTFRVALLAGLALALPIAAHAQPVTGPYVSLAGGANIASPFNYNYLNYNMTITGKLTSKLDYTGDFALGYGFGNGFRIELTGNYDRNTIHKNAPNYAPSAAASGGENTYGPMVNLLYDIPVGLPVIPYVGGGVGYQWVKFDTDIKDTTFGDSIGGTTGSVAYDAIVGLALPISAVPGLSLTAEYKLTELLRNRNYQANSGGFADGLVKVNEQVDQSVLGGLRYQLFSPPPTPPAPTPEQPVTASPAPAPAKTYLVFFDWDKATLTPRATEIIAEAATDSHTNATTTIDVSGYTDTSGTPVYNQGLSERRAKAVAAQLVADGVSASEIETHAYGETHLLVPTGPGVREPQNRRVEIVLQ